METNFKGRSFLTLKDFTQEEILYLLKLAKKEKENSKTGIVGQRFLGKSLAMLFEKRSTRTRCAFETAFGEEGGNPVFLSSEDIQLGAKESVEDTARVLGRMFDAIEFRGFQQEVASILSKYSDVPVYNGLTDLYHPTQTLADLLTIWEEFGTLKGVKLVYVGDGRNNVANSLMVGCCKMGLDFSIAGPKELWPDSDLLEYARSSCEESGGSITITNNLVEAVKGAHAIYTDVWVSMGEEDNADKRVDLLSPYQVNDKLMKETGNKEAIFMHCLPAVKGMEVTFDVIEGPRSRVWDEAENRKHTIKALMLATI